MSMTNKQYLPPVVRAIGSSYLIRQTAGSERVGGLEVTIKVLAEPPGQIRVKGTFRDTDTTWASMGNMGEAAIRGIITYAKAHDINLDLLDIEIGRFLYHPVDSRAELYFTAAQHAFRAARGPW